MTSPRVFVLALPARRLASCASRALDQTLDDFSDDGAEDEDEYRHNDLRQVQEHYGLEEDCDVREIEDVERREETDEDREPLHKRAEEAANIKVEAGALRCVIEASCLQSIVYTEHPDDLYDKAIEDDTDDPADDKHDYCR